MTETTNTTTDNTTTKKSARKVGRGKAAKVVPINAAAVQKSEQEQQELKQRLREVMNANALTLRQVAKQVGANYATLGSWLEGKRSGKAVADAVEAWLSKRMRNTSSRDTYVETPTAERIAGVLAHAQSIGDMGVVYGGPGVGKTSAARQYQREQPERVWLATITPAASGLVSALECVASAVGLADASGGARRISSSIRTRIAGSRGLLIIDEAQHLSMAAIEELRSIHDVTEIGLVFIGNETSYSRLIGGTRAAHYAQIFSRLGIRLGLPKTTAADVTQIAKSWGVVDKEAIAFLKRLADRPGALRGAVKALRLVALRKHKVTVESLRAAVQALGAEV